MPGPPKPAPRPGGSTNVRSGPDSIAAYAQSLRVGRAAYDRLAKLLPALTSSGAPSDLVILDARRALRELDDALAHTTDPPLMMDPKLEGDRDDLKRKRDVLPDDALARIGAHRIGDGELAKPPVKPVAQTTRRARLTLSEDDVSFTTTYVGRSQAKTIDIRNDDDETLWLAASAPGKDFDVILHEPHELAPGKSTRMVLIYRPTAPGHHRGMLSVNTVDTGVTLAVDGTAAARPAKLEPEENGPYTPSLATSVDRMVFTAGGHQRLWVTNASGEPVTLHHTIPVTVDGDPAFSAKVLGDRTLGPGDSAVVEVDFDHANYAGRRTKLVIRSLLGSIEVPIEGPRDAPFAPRFRQVLDVFPRELTYPQLRVETKGAARPAVKFRPDAPWVTLHNRSKDRMVIANVRSESGGKSGFALKGPTQGKVTVEPGATATFVVGFDPHAIGTARDRFIFEGPKGVGELASLPVEGEVVQYVKDAVPPRPVADRKADKDAAKPGDARSKDAAKPRAPELDGPTATATQAQKRWLVESLAALNRSHAVLSADWDDYLRFTSVNPRIPDGLLEGPDVVKDLLSNAFGNFIADNAMKGLGKILSAAGVALMATGVGFAVGVLIETAAGLVFNAVADDPNKAIEKAYEQGQTDGGRKVGTAMADKGKELQRALAASIQKVRDQDEEIDAIISRSDSAADLARIAAELTAAASALTKADARKGSFTRDMLSLWVRAHAAGTGRALQGDAQGLWTDAVTFLSNQDPDHFFSTGQLRNQPDLFVAQCAAEWERRGLPMSEGLRARLTQHTKPEALRDPKQAEKLAARFAATVSHLEITWDDFAMDHLPRDLAGVLAEQLPRYPGTAAYTPALVTSTPVLAVERGCCVVKKFLYRVVDRKHHNVWGMRSTPGGPLHYVQNGSSISLGAESEFFSPAKAEQNANLYKLIADLERAGTPIVQLDRTDGNALLTRQFGGELTKPREQHHSGRDETVTVFKAGKVTRPRGWKSPVPSRGIDEPYPGLEVIVRGDHALIRGGNAVLVVDGAQLAVLGGKSTEPDRRFAKERQEREDRIGVHGG